MKKLTARAFLDSLSTAGRLSQPETSEQPPLTMSHDIWDGEKWVERILVWNGVRYVLEVAA